MVLLLTGLISLALVDVLTTYLIQSLVAAATVEAVLRPGVAAAVQAPAFTSSGSRNIGPAGPVVTKVKATESESSHKRPT